MRERAPRRHGTGRRFAGARSRAVRVVVIASALGAGVFGAPMLSSAFSAAPAAATPLPPTVEAWLYPGSAGEPTCRAADELTALAASPLSLLKPEYLTVTRTGRVAIETAASLPCNGFSAANLAAVRAAATRVEVTVSAGRPGTRAVLAKPARSAAALSAITTFVSANHLDGVDLDFEPGRWSARLWQQYVQFVAGLVAQLAPAGRGVEVDLGPFTATPWDAERYADVAAAGAHLVVMAYDHQYDVACAPISPYDWLAAVVAYARSQVPAAALSVGLPAYGYTTTTCTRPAHITTNVAYVTMRGAPGFPTGAASVAAARDPASGELRWSVGATHYDVVDATALNDKLQVVEAAGVGDVSVWSLGGEPWFSGDPG